MGNNGFQLARGRKICVVTPSHWAGYFGGAEFQIRLLLDVLLERSAVKVTYLARYVSRSFVDSRYSTRQIRSFALLSRLGFWPDFPFLLKMLEQERPDVIYQRVGCAYTGICAAYACIRGARLVWHISLDNDLDRDIGRFHPLSRSTERQIRDFGIKRADCIVAQTHQQAELLRVRFRKEAVVIKNFQAPASSSSNKAEVPTVVWVANLKPTKRPELFLETIRETSQALGIHFVMIGRGGDREPYATIISDVAKFWPLAYVGEKTVEETNDLIASAHILVNTSTVEGFPNTFIQAWFRSTVVVSLDVDPDGVLQKHDLGLVARSPKALASTIETLVHDDILRESIADRALKYAANEHSLENANRLASIILGE